MSTIFLANKLISPTRSGFKPADLRINQLLSIITSQIFKPFDDELKIRTVFIDISKGLEKVWHEWQNDISGELLHIFSDF